MSFDGRSIYFVREGSYRGRTGFHIGERVVGHKGGFRISIFTETRDAAETIRDAYTAHEKGRISRDERDVLVSWALGGTGIDPWIGLA